VAASDGAKMAAPYFVHRSPPPFPHFNRPGTVLAVKGSLRRAQQRRALDGSGPFQKNFSWDEGKAPLAKRLSDGATSLPFWPLF